MQKGKERNAEREKERIMQKIGRSTKIDLFIKKEVASSMKGEVINKEVGAKKNLQKSEELINENDGKG